MLQADDNLPWKVITKRFGLTGKGASGTCSRSRRRTRPPPRRSARAPARGAVEAEARGALGEFFGYLVTGLANGSIYALVALGVVIIYRVSRVINLAAGAIGVFSAFVFHYVLMGDSGLPVAVGHDRRDHRRCGARAPGSERFAVRPGPHPRRAGHADRDHRRAAAVHRTDHPALGAGHPGHRLAVLRQGDRHRQHRGDGPSARPPRDLRARPGRRAVPAARPDLARLRRHRDRAGPRCGPHRRAAGRTDHHLHLGHRRRERRAGRAACTSTSTASTRSA